MAIDTRKASFLVWSAIFLIAFRALTARDFEGNLGNDYSYFLSWLLAGHFWFTGNGFAIPWFSPAFCAGVPHFSNPQSLFFSVPQLLTIFFDPSTSVLVTHWVFGIVGFIGAVLLASTVTRSSMIMQFAGFAFALNGMTLSRMYVGHLTFHAIMLLPLICYLVLRPGRGPADWVATIAVGAMLAYFVHSGAGVLIVPAGATLVLMLVLMAKGVMPWIKLLVAGCVGLLLSLNKLVAVSYYMVLFPRGDLYSMPGAASLVEAIHAAFRSLVWPLGREEIDNTVVNTAFLLEQVELNYAVGIVPVVVIALYLVIRRPAIGIPSRRWWIAGPILLLPVVLTTFHPAWHEFLERLPYFAQASSLFRWHLIYILPVILLTVFCMDRLDHPLLAPTAILALLVSTLAYLPDAPRQYDGQSIVDAWHRVDDGAGVPNVRQLEEALIDGKRVPLANEQDSLARGASQLVCNEPLFGYRLENFRFDAVFRGAVFVQHGGAFNFYRPECFLYPQENACEKGDRFQPDDASRLVRFTSYRSIEFEMPVMQKTANWFSVLGFWAVVVTMISALVIGMVRCIQKFLMKGEVP